MFIRTLLKEVEFDKTTMRTYQNMIQFFYYKFLVQNIAMKIPNLLIE